MITFQCHDCGKQYNVSDDKAGKRAKCSCGAVIAIPLLSVSSHHATRPAATRGTPDADDRPSGNTARAAVSALEHATTTYDMAETPRRPSMPASPARPRPVAEYDDATKRKKIVEYFQPPQRHAFGIVLGIIGLLCLPVDVWLGISLVVVGGAIIYRAIKTQQGGLSDGEFDQWLQEDLGRCATRALPKLGIDQTELVSEPAVVTGIGGGMRSYYKKGKDGVLRFSPIQVTVVEFTANQLLVYSCAYDFTTGNPLNEATDEYFYKDVVSVTTRTQSMTLTTQQGPLQLNAAEVFSLTTAGGTSIEVLLKDEQLIRKWGGGVIPTTQAEKALGAIRKMLREKKA